MNAKSSTRLRLECLETRSLLSAVGFPFVPPLTVPSPVAVPGEYYRSGGHQVAQSVMQDVVQNVVAIPNANPMLTPDRLSPGFRDPLGAVGLPSANPMLVPDQLAPGLRDVLDAAALLGANPILMPDQPSSALGNSPYEQPAAEARLSDPVPVHDFRRAGDPTIKTSLLPDLTLDPPNGLAVSGSVDAIQNLSDTSFVMAVNAPQLQVDVAITAGDGDIDPDSGVPSPELARHDELSYHDTFSIFFVIHLSPQPRSQDEIAPDAAAAIDPPALPPVIETLPGSRGLVGYRSPPSQMVEPSIESDLSTAIDPSTPLAKSHSPDTLPASYDGNRAVDQAAAAVETSLPASNGMTNPAATTAALMDATNTNSMEGGFITLDDTFTTTPRLGNSPSPNSSLNGVKGTELDQGNWLSDLLPNPSKPVDSGSRSSNAARSGASLAADVSSRPARVVLQPVADTEEGGSIELAIAAPSGAANDDSPLVGESTAGSAAQQLARIRPESGVELFCDIEVAVAPTLPMGILPSAAIPDQNAGSLAIGAGLLGWKANSATEVLPPLSKLPQATMAGLTDNLPLLMGVTVLVSRGGLR
ncbi:MAG: hypothetical protein ABSG53_27435, partial [Thermoguttaceae bacterium]